MSSEALGMIEVRGFLGAVCVADAALKAADVKLLHSEIIRGGLTTIEITGDVAAVNAAIDAGVVVGDGLNCMVSHHVIPRLDSQTRGMVDPKLNPTETESILIDEEPIEDPITNVAEIQHENKENLQTSTNQRRLELSKKKVVELRKLAYSMELQTLKKSEIKFANKEVLINAILAELERSENDWN